MTGESVDCVNQKVFEHIVSFRDHMSEIPKKANDLVTNLKIDRTFYVKNEEFRLNIMNGL